MATLIIIVGLASILGLLVIATRRNGTYALPGRGIVMDETGPQETRYDADKTLNITQERLTEILKDVKNHKAYYAGGSLCIDDVLDDDVLVVNLDGVCLSFKGDGCMDMSKENTDLAFAIYEKYRGKTEYYNRMLADRK